mgnify:CR=1 FL=1
MDMKVKENLENYKNIMISYWIMVFLVRLLEVSNMLLTFGNEEGMLVSELGGFCVDIVCGSAILLILLPLYTVFPVKAKKIIIWVFLVLFSILLVIHILLLQYFFNQHKPLGTLLFGYSMDEILFTVGTANISLLAVFFEILVILALFWTVYFIIKDKINWRFAGVVAVVSLPFALVLLVVPKNFFNNQSLEIIDTLKDTPRFDVYFTGSTHSPFIISEPEKYDERLLKMRNLLEKNTDRKFYKHYNDYARTLLFLDDALFEFFEKYSQRDDYQNTIFVITGDHPMTEIPPENLLKRYHVPFVIYSPRLKTSMTFKNMVSHLDFFETMMAFMEKYGIERLDESAAFGGNMFMNNDNFAFMNEPRDVVDFYSDGYYISGKDIYKVDDAFNIKRINDSDRFELLEEKLATIRKISEFTSLENYIMHADYYKKVLKTNKDK